MAENLEGVYALSGAPSFGLRSPLTLPKSDAEARKLANVTKAT